MLRQEETVTNSSQQLPSSGADSKPTTTSSSLKGQQFAYEPAEDVAMPYDEHWASPTEVLQFRALWDAAQLKHREEVRKLRQSLADSERDRAQLYAEVQETGKLREQYRAAKIAFETVRQEKLQWQEEREMLMLRLQRMANEIDRLRSGIASSSSQGTSDASAGAPLWSASGGSNNTVHPAGLVGLADGAEMLKLLEELHRAHMTVAHLEQRFELQTVLSHFEGQRAMRSRLQLVSENEALKSQLRAQSDGEESTRRTLRFAQQEARSLRDELERVRQEAVASETQRRQALLDSERQWETSWKDDVDTKEAEWRVKEQSLAHALADSQSSATQATEKLALCKAELERLRHQHDADATAAAEVIEALRRERDEATQAKSLTETRWSLQVAALNDDLKRVTDAREEYGRKLELQVHQVEDLLRETHGLRIRLEQQGVELSRHRLREEELLRSAEVAKLLEGERDAFRVRAVKLEEEIGVQKDFYSKQLRVAQHAFTKLQQQKRAETEVLLRDLVALKARVRNGDASGNAAGKDNVTSPTNNRTASSRGDDNPPEAQAKPIDPLTLLRQTAVLAEKLQAAVQQ